MFVFTLILLFILKFKFPKRKSIVNVSTVSGAKSNRYKIYRDSNMDANEKLPNKKRNKNITWIEKFNN